MQHSAFSHTAWHPFNYHPRFSSPAYVLQFTEYQDKSCTTGSDTLWQFHQSLKHRKCFTLGWRYSRSTELCRARASPYSTAVYRMLALHAAAATLATMPSDCSCGHKVPKVIVWLTTFFSEQFVSCSSLSASVSQFMEYWATLWQFTESQIIANVS
ncbi:hypothetical protein MTO96_002222 [Rhipicephalus appendiculatus]